MGPAPQTITDSSRALPGLTRSQDIDGRIRTKPARPSAPPAAPLPWACAGLWVWRDWRCGLWLSLGRGCGMDPV